MRRALALAALAFAAASPAGAQSGATVTGLTRDSSSNPVAGVEVVAHPGNRRTRSDSTGRFTLKGLDGGSYQITGRKFGYTPGSWDVKLTKSGHVDIQIILGFQSALLDTVEVTAGRQCSVKTLDGFACRRRVGGGLFLDYTDIDDKEPVYTADIFRDIKGFRIDVRSTRLGEVVRTPVYMRRCVVSFVDGMQASPANPIPTIAQDITAMELFLQPDSVPAQFKRYAWFNGADGRCALVVYWTTRAHYKH